MYKKIFSLSFLLFIQLVSAQQIEDAWVFLTGKPQAATMLSQPLNILSQRALDRRQNLNIPLDEKDVPVDNNYLNQIKNATGITYRAKSKWLNAIHVQGTQTAIQNLLNFSFVDHIEFANKNIGIINRPHTWQPTPQPVSRRVNYDYGAGATQINMLHGEVMHQQNFTGNGVLVGIIDAGFEEVNTASLFQHLYQNSKVVDVYNFVSNDQNVYQFSMHGSGVLSTIAAKSNGVLVGTAPDVQVALYVSEDISQEMPIEESYWAEAAERADSIGVNVINTSLGYMTFDRAEYSYTMDDLDGQTSFISRAAEIAVSRGINVVVAAGNSGGNSSWPKIGMPADAEHVITVGAVDANRVRAYFSSIGPTADGRIKPDVMAQGQETAVYWYGQIQNLDGTSFSSPVTAGMVACMVQAFPNKTPAQIKQNLLSISDRFNNPNNEYGYGIPNFQLYDTSAVDELSFNNVNIYPNPATDFLFIKNKDKLTYEVYSLDGKLVLKGIDNKINIKHLSSGIYILKSGKTTQKFLVK